MYFLFIIKVFLFVCLFTVFLNIRQYFKNSLLSSLYIPVIYLLSNIPNFSVIFLSLILFHMCINSVFIMLTFELEIFSTETDMVSRE